MATKRAAIPADALDRPLGELNAAEFLTALEGARITAPELGILADKKKYELWVEETQVSKIPVRDLLERIRGEKKKLELEKSPRWEYVKRDVELEIDPRHLFDPVVFGPLVEEIATQVANKLQR